MSEDTRSFFQKLRGVPNTPVTLSKANQPVDIDASALVMALSKHNKPVFKDWSTASGVKDGFKASTWVFACVRKLMVSASTANWNVYRKDGTSKEYLPEHPLQDLIEQPNAFMSQSDYIERLVAHLQLGGNGVTWKNEVEVAGRKIVAEIWPLMPDTIKPIADAKGYLSHYHSTVNKKDIPVEQIMHHMLTDPSNPFWGMAPMQAAGKTVDTDIEAVNWNKAALQNRAVSDGAFVFEGELSQDQWAEAKRQIRDQHTTPDNARTPWVLGSNAKWQQFSMSPAEMDFINSRRMTREEICAAFAVPPPLVGIFDNANYSNIETARRIFWYDTMIPLLDDLLGTFKRSLLPAFGEENLCLEYDVSHVDVFMQDYKERVESGAKLWSIGVPLNTVNERLELGFEEIQGGNVGYVPASAIPATSTTDSDGFGSDEEF